MWYWVSLSIQEPIQIRFIRIIAILISYIATGCTVYKYSLLIQSSTEHLIHSESVWHELGYISSYSYGKIWLAAGRYAIPHIRLQAVWKRKSVIKIFNVIIVYSSYHERSHELPRTPLYWGLRGRILKYWHITCPYVDIRFPVLRNFNWLILVTKPV